MWLLISLLPTDIDGKFGMLWQHIKGKTIITPQEYAKSLNECYSRGLLPFELLDVYVLPDFTSFLSPFIDNQFGK